jgi:hypothetical protein
MPSREVCRHTGLLLKLYRFTSSTGGFFGAAREPHAYWMGGSGRQTSCLQMRGSFAIVSLRFGNADKSLTKSSS